MDRVARYLEARILDGLTLYFQGPREKRISRYVLRVIAPGRGIDVSVINVNGNRCSALAACVCGDVPRPNIMSSSERMLLPSRRLRGKRKVPGF